MFIPLVVQDIVAQYLVITALDYNAVHIVPYLVIRDNILVRRASQVYTYSVVSNGVVVDGSAVNFTAHAQLYAIRVIVVNGIVVDDSAVKFIKHAELYAIQVVVVNRVVMNFDAGVQLFRLQPCRLPSQVGADCSAIHGNTGVCRAGPTLRS